VEKTWNAPATCVDCGNDAYIRMAQGPPKDDGTAEMLCAHCYAGRLRKGKIAREAPEPSYRVSGIRSQ
jgi:hypothetical protein